MVKTIDFLQFTSLNSKFGVHKLQDPIAVRVIDNQYRQFPLYNFV
jgi:hypothetical protein